VKIALLVNHFGEPWAEGGKNNLRRIAMALAEQHDLVVLGLGPRTETLTVDGIPVYRFRSPGYSNRLARVGYPFGYLRLVARSREVLEEHQPDLIFSYFETASTAVVSAGLRRLWAPQTPLVHTVWSDWFRPTRMPARHWFSEAIPQAILNGRMQSVLGLMGVDRVLAASQYLADEVSALGHATSFTPAGIDTQRFAPAPNRLRPGSGPVFRVGYLGHTTYAKGVSLLLEAIRYVIDLEPDITLSLAVTPGAEETSVIEAIRHPRITCKGLVDPAEFYNGLDLVILPRRFSYGTATYPRVLLEAMACGTPVLTARLPAIDEVIQEDENGFLFEAGNVTDLRRKIVELYRSRATLGDVGDRAREAALGHDWAEVLPSVLAEVDRFAKTASV